MVGAVSSVSDAARRTRACLRSFRKTFSTGTPDCDFRLVSIGLRVCVSIRTPIPPWSVTVLLMLERLRACYNSLPFRRLRMGLVS